MISRLYLLNVFVFVFEFDRKKFLNDRETELLRLIDVGCADSIDSKKQFGVIKLEMTLT
jgi:hypothetical protein